MTPINPDEQIDIINEQNIVVGITSKSLAHKDGSLHRIVIGELVNSRGEYCFVRQASDRQDAGQFVSPIGGHVGAGESGDDALIRECQEECGFTPDNFHFVGHTIYNREVIGRKENHYFLVYKILTDQNPVLNHESVEFKWFSVAGIKQILEQNSPVRSLTAPLRSFTRRVGAGGPDTFGAAWHHVFKNIFPTIYHNK